MIDVENRLGLGQLELRIIELLTCLGTSAKESRSNTSGIWLESPSK